MAYTIFLTFENTWVSDDERKLLSWLLMRERSDGGLRLEHNREEKLCVVFSCSLWRVWRRGMTFIDSWSSENISSCSVVNIMKLLYKTHCNVREENVAIFKSKEFSENTSIFHSITSKKLANSVSSQTQTWSATSSEYRARWGSKTVSRLYVFEYIYLECFKYSLAPVEVRTEDNLAAATSMTTVYYHSFVTYYFSS